MIRLLFFALLFCMRPSFAFDETNKNAGRANPDIGINALILGQSASLSSEHDNGIGLQELELQFSSNIDPYWSGSALISIHPEETPEGEIEHHVEPEEVYFENLSLPGFSFRIGKQKIYFGKLNTTHAHAQPFIDPSLTVESIFGEEGLNESGVAASYLIPAKWYSEIILQVFNADNENVFGSPTKGDPAEVLYFKNLWDLNPDSTFEWILSAGVGKNKSRETTTLANTAVTYKWRSHVASSQKALSMTAEYTRADLKSTLDSSNVLFSDLDPQSALSFWLIYKLNRNWFAQARTEAATTYAEDSFTETIDLKKNTLLVGYAPTEFSAMKLQYDLTENSAADEKEHRVGLQFNFSMGAHPAHNY